MYGTEAESTSQPSNATVTVNDIVVTLPESVPYDEPPSWRTKVTLTTNHSDSSKTDDVYRNIISLFRGERIIANLVQLWKELKKQYNAVLQKLLTREESHQIVLEMFMFSQRGHESYKREISDGRFSRVLLLLFEEMTEGKVNSDETSFDVTQEGDNRFTETTPPPSPTSTIRSFGEQSVDSLASFSESIALGGFFGDPYGSVQEFLVGHADTPVDSSPLPPLVNRRQLTEAEVQTNTTIPVTVGPLPLSTSHLHKVRSQLDSSMSRQHSDVRNTQEKDKMEIIRRIEKLEKITKQSHATTEIMQASQKAAMDEGFSITSGNLKDFSEKMDDMERLFEEKIQGIPQVRIAQESEKIHDLSHEVKEFRRDFDRFRGETMEKLDSVEKSMFDAKHSIEQSVSDIKETLMKISKSLPTSPISSPEKSVSHVHLSSHHHTHDQSFTLPNVDTHITVAKLSEDSDSSSSRKSSGKLVQREDEKVNSIHQPHTIKLSDMKNIQSETQLENRDEQLPSMSVERSDQTLHTESSRVPILSPELEAALQHAEHEGILSELESESGDSMTGLSSSVSRPTVEGATGFSNEPMHHGSGHTLPFQPMSLVDTYTDQDEQAILAETQRTLRTDAEIVFEANECRKTSRLPLTVDVLKVLSKAIQESKDNSSLPEPAEGGIDTILCLDLSASVEGKAFEQLKSVLIEYLTDAEDLSVRRNLHENIAIVVMGLKTEIMFPLNVNYSDMLDQICNLRTGGTSPVHTALVLCQIALKEKGGPMLIGRYIIPARIVLFSDGRPTDDSQMHDLMSEYREKPSEMGERLKAMAHELHYQGYTLFTVPIGAHVNRMILKDIASVGGGKMVNLEDFGFIKKYFYYQVIAGGVIENCHNTGNQSNYPEFIQREVNQVDSGLDQDDIIHITEIIHTSQELDDKEHDNLPSLGSRVQILSGEATSQSLPFGTVIQNLNDGWIKVQFDTGLIHFYHYSNSDHEVVKIVTSPRQLRKDQLIDCGISVCDLENPDKKGVVFRVTISGYVYVRWENGTKSRHKYGADGEFDLQIHNESIYTVFYQWQYFESEQWINFDTTSNSRIEQSFQKKDKTCLVDEDRARILFDREHMKYIGKEILIPVRRLEEY